MRIQHASNTANTLMHLLLATALMWSAHTQAAPAGEQAATTTYRQPDQPLAADEQPLTHQPIFQPADEPTATLEISRLAADEQQQFSNNFPPNDFATTDEALYYNGGARPYATIEVEAESELASTSLPMTREEIALAEVASIVAELSTTTANEIKAKTLLPEAKKGDEAAEEERNLIRQRAEEAERQTIERVIANAAEAAREENELVAATTHRAPFVDVVGTTATATMPAITNAVVAPTTATETTNTTEPATSVSPIILNELVKAAAQANEILAAALNVASMAVTNITAITNNTTSAAFLSSEGTTTSTSTAATAESDATTGRVDDDHDSVTLATSDIQRLPEPSVMKEMSAVEATSTTTEMKGETMDAVRTTPTGSVYRAPPYLPDMKHEIKDDVGLFKASLSGSVMTKDDLPKIAAITEQEKIAPNAEMPIGFQGQNENEADAAVTDAEPMKPAIEADNEVAESKQILTNEATEITPTNDDNEVEPLTSEKMGDGNTDGYHSEKTTAIPTKETENKSAQNAIEKPQTEANSKVTATTESSTSVAGTDENHGKLNESEIAEVLELKLGSRHENNEKEKHEKGSEKEKEETKTNTLETEDLLTTTTEPLETLIAVESEAQPPKEIVVIGDEEDKTPLAEFTTAAYPEENAKLAEFTTTAYPFVESITETKVMQESTARTNQGSIKIVADSETVSGTLPTQVAEFSIETASEHNVAVNSAANGGAQNLPENIPDVDQTTTANERSLADIVFSTSSQPETTPNVVTAPITEHIQDLTTAKDSTSTEIKRELPGLAIASFDSTTKPTQQELISTRHTTNLESNREETREQEKGITEAAATRLGEPLEPLDLPNNLINVPLAPFTTTTTTEIAANAAETLIPEKTTTTNIELDGYVTYHSGKGELVAGGYSTEKTQTQTAGEAMTTTLTGSSATTTNQPTVSELQRRAQAHEIYSTYSDTTATTNSGDTLSAAPTTTTTTTAAELPPITEPEPSTITTTTAKAEALTVGATTLETAETEQPLYMRSRGTANEQQQQHKAEKENEKLPVPEIEVRQQNFYISELYEQERAKALAASSEREEEAAINAPEDATSTELVQLAQFTDSTSTTTTPTTTTTEELKTTTTTSMPETETTTTSSETTEETKTTTAETLAPDSESTITTTNTTVAEASTTTTTTTSEPETSTTTTTTLSPMSLIIAEHEARSLDKTPPRVSRIVSDDGVEVLSGYSIVHHMHALAVLAAAADGA